MKKLESLRRKIWIQIERIGDHIWTYLAGIPQLRYSEITPTLYLGGQYKLHALKQFKERGITGIVNMRMRSKHTDISNLPWVSILQLPTIDGDAPTLQNLQKGVQFIHAHIQKGGKVYVHCRHGEGRGPTMAIAFLISTGMTLNDAYEVVRDVRTFAHPNKRQMNRLRSFEKMITSTAR